jgi:hypothetical protein
MRSNFQKGDQVFELTEEPTLLPASSKDEPKVVAPKSGEQFTRVEIRDLMETKTVENLRATFSGHAAARAIIFLTDCNKSGSAYKVNPWWAEVGERYPSYAIGTIRGPVLITSRERIVPGDFD